MSHVFRNGVVKCVLVCFVARGIMIVIKRSCGVNAYQCDTCGNVYKSKKSLCGHRRKHHTDDVHHFTFFCGECELYQFLTYMMQIWTENFS